MIFFRAALFVFMGMAANLFAQTESIQENKDHRLIRLNIGVSIANGGDDLTNIVFADGRSGKIKAGNGAAIYAGIYFDRKDSAINFLLNTGLKNDIEEGENEEGESASSEMQLYFLDAIMLYQPHRFHRFGLGLSAQLLPELSINSTHIHLNKKYENSLGYLLQYEYIFRSKSAGIPSLGIRYTGLELTEKDNKAVSYDASSISLSANYAF